MKNKTTQELMDELSSKLILKLYENEVPCPTCHGLRFIHRQQSGASYITDCKNCYNGKVTKCEYCGKLNKTDHCDCKEAEESRRTIQDNIEYERERGLFNKATKIKFNDYKGKFILGGNDTIQDKDSVYEWLYDEVKYQYKAYDELPKYIWATKSQPALTLDLDDIINTQCEDDGYEDMYSNLDMDDKDLILAQEYLNKWYDKQGDAVNIYYEDYSVAVLLDDLIAEIKEELTNEYIDELHEEELETQRDVINSTR